MLNRIRAAAQSVATSMLANRQSATRVPPGRAEADMSFSLWFQATQVPSSTNQRPLSGRRGVAGSGSALVAAQPTRSNI